MTDVTPRPEVTPADRLGLTVCLAVIAHAIVILGVTFASEDKVQPRYDTMDIVLVQEKSKAPDKARLLAQSVQRVERAAGGRVLVTYQSLAEGKPVLEIRNSYKQI